MSADRREGCLHCGRPTEPGRWRCTVCQLEHDAKRDGVLAILADARKANSRAAER